MTQEELNKAVELHKLWLENKETGVRLKLHNADLRNLDLANADLSLSILDCVDLSGANLNGVDLSHANLSCSYLCGADFSYANFSKAILRSVSLRNASLISINARGADFSCADLRNSDFFFADLSGSRLKSANLIGATFNGANFRNANLINAIIYDVNYNSDTIFFALQCPEEGSFIGFKKIYDYTVKLEIPAEAKRSSATSRKCRCEFAKVLEIVDSEGNQVEEITNYSHEEELMYKVGEMVYPDRFDEDRWRECSHGIHFFITRREAELY